MSVGKEAAEETPNGGQAGDAADGADAGSNGEAAPVVELKAVAVFGGVEITVPEGLRLEVEGVGIFGGFSHQTGEEGDPGAPLVRITGVAFFGGVDVKRGPRRAVPPSTPGPLGPGGPPPPSISPPAPG